MASNQSGQWKITGMMVLCAVGVAMTMRGVIDGDGPVMIVLGVAAIVLSIYLFFRVPKPRR